MCRGLQRRENHKAALFFFEKAGRYNHAVRVAKQVGLDDELAALALQASKRVQLDAARCVCAGGAAPRGVCVGTCARCVPGRVLEEGTPCEL